MTKFKFLDEEQIEHMPPEPGDTDIILLEVAYQLRRIADKMEEK